jgi:cytochrome P450
MTIFLAGHETSATVLMWTWYLLSQHPAAEARLHAELKSVLGDREPQPEDARRLPFLEMLLSEVMRLCPPLWAFARQALSRSEIEAQTIEPGDVVLVSPFVTHHDARWFPDPERFDPDRWTPELREARPRFSYFPFSAGSRGCLGESFAWMESLLAVATLAQKWRLALVPGHRIELQPQLTLRSKFGMKMQLCRTH